MKKKLSEKFKNILDLKDARRRMIFHSSLMALLLLGINTYAWFIYIEQFDGSISANVISWDVTFYDDDVEMESVYLNIDNLYPGMNDYQKEIMVNNEGGIVATFQYDVVSLTLFGDKYTAGENIDEEVLTTAILEELPFNIYFIKGSEEINPGASSTFSIYAEWDFESTEAFYRLNDFYDYDASHTYYTTDGTSYTKVTDINVDNFDSRVEEGLYIDSDTADSYWGKKAAKLKAEDSSVPCITLEVDLIITQKSS